MFRMETTKVPKVALHWTPEGKQNRGRPRITCAGPLRERYILDVHCDGLHVANFPKIQRRVVKARFYTVLCLELCQEM